MVDERCDFVTELQSFTDILFNEEIKYPQQHTVHNFATHSDIPFVTPDSSTVTQTAPTFNYLPLLVHQTLSEEPKETKAGKANFPVLSSTTNDVGGNWFSTPPSCLFGFQQQQQRPLSIFNSTAWNTKPSKINGFIGSKVESVDNLIRILFHYRNAVDEGGVNFSEIFCHVMRYMGEFLNMHDGHHQDKVMIINRLGTMQTQAAAQLLPVKQEINTKFIDRVPISFELWCHAAVVFREECLNDAGRVLLRGIFTNDELSERTIGVRVDRKTGQPAKALNPLKLGVIFKILAWMKLMGTGGDSWGDYNPDNPLNPSLKPNDQKPLREFFAQQLNQAKQKAKLNKKFQTEKKGNRVARGKYRAKRE